MSRMRNKQVLSVGQCSADASAITRVLQKQFQATVDSVDTFDEAFARLHAGSVDLVLVNRILDADGSSGLELIQRIKSDTELRHLPVMLVSNYPEWQQEAVKLGAVPGFGKAGLGQPEMIGRLNALLDAARE
jgi:two-component system chemotaxis response regulator CheY